MFSWEHFRVTGSGVEGDACSPEYNLAEEFILTVLRLNHHVDPFVSELYIG